MSNEIEKDTTEPIVDIKEIEAAKQDAASSSVGTYIQKFDPPFTYTGKTYKELRFDWENLPGTVDAEIEMELSARGKSVVAPEFSSEYQILLAVKGCTEKIGADAFDLMPYKARMQIKRAVRGFLLSLA